MTVFIVTLTIMLVGIAMISVRIIFKEGGEFHGTCSSRQANGKLADLEKDKGCVCGRRPGEECPSKGDDQKDADFEHGPGNGSVPANQH